MKKKALIIVIISVLILFLSATTYSFFRTNVIITTTDQNIAKFIFNAEEVDEVNLPLSNLYPGESKDYLFSVYNNEGEKISKVTINYKLTIKTLHIIPLTIELYRIKKNNIEELMLVCDEKYSRDSENELVCNSSTQELLYDNLKNDNYKLKVSFPDEYNDVKYSELVDYVDITIKSWQKIEG